MANSVDAGEKRWQSVSAKESPMSERRPLFLTCLSVKPRITHIALALVLAIAGGVVAPSAHAQSISLLHLFSGPDGVEPEGTLTMDRAGNLYGTTTFGGAGYGTVFKLSRAGTGWILSTLYTFTGGADGASPTGAVVFGPDGSLYGTTDGGGQTLRERCLTFGLPCRYVTPFPAHGLKLCCTASASVMAQSRTGRA